MIFAKKRHFEIVPAKLYYGKHAIGSVMLCNGNVVIHLPTKGEIVEFLRRASRKGAI
jgi:hypothetical protein